MLLIHCGEELLLALKIFRENLVQYFSSTFGFTEFFQKIAIAHCGKSNSVEIAEILSHFFLQKFRESDGFTKEITK